jgi:hypothetical protein
MPTKKASKKTGSQKLSAKRGAGAAQGDLAKALAALKKSGIRNDILIRGIPIPDVFKGTIIATTGQQAGSALNALIKIRNATFKPVKLFPRGIPVIDVIEIQIDGKINR